MEEYGIELKLVLDKFNQKMEEIKNKFKGIENVQVDAGKQFKIDNLTKRMQIAQQQLDQLQQKYKKLTQEEEEYYKDQLNYASMVSGGGMPIEEYLKGNTTYEKMIEQLDRLKLQIESAKIKVSEFEEKINNTYRKAQIEAEKLKEKEIFEKQKQRAIQFEQRLQPVLEKMEKLRQKTKEVENSKGFNNTNFSKMGKGIEKATSKIKRFGLALFSIRSIYSLISRASSAYLAQDTELSNKITAAWTALGSMLAPIIEAIATGFIKLVKYINVFIKALTGVDLVAKAMNKTLKNANKSAKALSKTLAGFDELTNLDTTTDSSKVDTSWIDAYNSVDIDTTWADRIESFGNWIKNNKEVILGLFTGLAIISGNNLVTAVGAAILIFDGFKKMINGDVTDAIVGFIEVIGGAGLIGYLVSGVNGMSVAIAVASVITVIKGLSDLLNGDAKTSLKGFIEVIMGSAGVIIALWLMKGGVSALISPINIATLGIIALIAAVVTITKNWSNMSTWQKVVSILGTLAIAAATAAAAVGALQSAWSLGIAAVAIVAGVAAIAAAVSSANKTAQDNLPSYDVGTNYVPEDQMAMIHKGEAIIPKKFNSSEYFGGGNEETNSLLSELIEAVNSIDINPYTTIKDVGNTAVNYINNRNRQLGRSVIA